MKIIFYVLNKNIECFVQIREEEKTRPDKFPQNIRDKIS